MHCSNFPIRIDAWKDEQGNSGDGLVAYCVSKGMDEVEVRRRVQVISQEVTDTWLDDKRLEGPWSYFRDLDINGCISRSTKRIRFFRDRGGPSMRGLWSNGWRKCGIVVLRWSL